jgi:NADH-quinone oxidoreductase subunit L
MVSRMSWLYASSGTASLVVAYIGAFTAVFAATMALTRNDIKRVLAYSTISQIGYMFIGCGVGAYAAGMFHLFTHAFFKSLLFLAAGSVIHALSGEQDLQKMGGLRKYLPRTYPAFLIGALAITGVPFFSGFFSKDAILNRAFSGGHYLIWCLGLLGAILTAFYMFRLIFLAFYGQERTPEESRKHIHESPPLMTVPLAVLAFFSLAAGYLGLPLVFGEKADWFGRFLDPAVKMSEKSHPGLTMEWGLLFLTTIIVLSGIYLAYILYLKNPQIPHALAVRFPGLYRILDNKYYVDEAYEAVFIRPLVRGSEVVYQHFDLKVIDGALNTAASGVGLAGKILSAWQTGLIKDYAFVVLLGTILLLGVLLF